MANSNEKNDEARVLAAIEATDANEAAAAEEEMNEIGPIRKERESKPYSKRGAEGKDHHAHWSGNCLHIEGQIVKEDPDLKLVGAEKDKQLCVLHFGRSQGKVPGSDDKYQPWLWLDVEIWGEYGVYVYDNFRKGERIALKGRLVYRERTGNDGKKYTNWVLVADHCHLVVEQEGERY